MLVVWLSQRVRYWESGNSCRGKKRETRRHFSEVTNAFKNGMCFAVNVLFQLSGHVLLQEEGLIISKRLGDDSMVINSSNGWLSKWKKGTASVKWRYSPRERWRQSRNSVKVGWSFKWTDERVWAYKCMEHEWDWPFLESLFHLWARKTLSWWQKLEREGNLGIFSYCVRRERHSYCC